MQTGLPIWARGAAAPPSVAGLTFVRWQETVGCGGVCVVPGDVIVCGTPTGAGARFDPPRWLKPGDVVEVEADGIGILRNGVADEQ